MKLLCHIEINWAKDRVIPHYFEIILESLLFLASFAPYTRKPILLTFIHK